MPSTVFYPPTDYHGPLFYNDAKAVCSGCTVRQACLDWALDHGEEFGCWGGLSPGERAEFAPGRYLFRCAICNQPFPAKSNKRFCSSECKALNKQRTRSSSG